MQKYKKKNLIIKYNILEYNKHAIGAGNAKYKN